MGDASELAKDLVVVMGTDRSLRSETAVEMVVAQGFVTDHVDAQARGGMICQCRPESKVARVKEWNGGEAIVRDPQRRNSCQKHHGIMDRISVRDMQVCLRHNA